jgi:hypothetical protein
VIIKKGAWTLIDVAIPGERNVVKKEAENILKYRDLTIEIQLMSNMKAKVIQAITGENGTISVSFRQYLGNIPAAIMGTVHILRKVLMQKYKTYITWEMTLPVAQIVNTEHPQHYMP